MITSKTEKMNRRTLVAALGGCLFPAASCKKARPITAGAREFTEQRILAEIIAQHLERRISGRIARRTGFENTQGIHQALMLHDIDLYVEYSGAEVAVVLQEVPDKNSTIVLERVRRAVEQARVVSWLDPLGFDNPFAVSIPGSIARQHRIETLEDAASYPPGWTMSTTSEFQQRRDGYRALVQAYPIQMRGIPVIQNAAAIYTAIETNHADMVAGRLTDSILAEKDLLVLKDPRNAFASCIACITVREGTLAAYPGLRPALAQLSGKFTTDLMRKMNVEVDGRRREPRDVAAAFLQSAGLA
jgi:glycine betaine/choline ABC-type transport system substrate-binding protein